MASGNRTAVAGEARGSRESRRWRILTLLCTAFFVAVSDSTIVYTALPSIQRGLDFSASGVQWVMIAFLLTAGGLLLLGGRTADLLDRRRMFLVGMGLFTGASLLCGLAWSGAVLVAARAVEGVAVAILVPAALSIVMATFPEGAERNRALGVWGSLAGVGATAGLLLGGPLTELLGWRSVFLVNVPVGLVVLALGPRLLPESQARNRPFGFDLAGGLAVTLALLTLVYAIVDAPQRGGPGGRTVALLATSALLGAVFLRIERHARDPLVPMHLFRSRSLVGGNLVVLAAGMAVDGLLFTFTLFAQQVLGYSAIEFGLAMAVMTVTSFVGVAAGQRLVTRIGARPVASTGLLLIGTGSLLLTQASPDRGFAGPIVVGLLLFGPGLGAAFVAGQIAALTGVADADAGLASGVEETTFAVGSALGVAILSGVALSSADLMAGSAAAFIGVAAFAALGLVAATVLLRSPRRLPRPERYRQAPPAPGSGGDPRVSGRLRGSDRRRRP